MESFPTSFAQLRKYLDTWKKLILHPRDFFKGTLQNKRRDHWPAIGFLFSAVLAADYAGSILDFLYLWFLDPAQPMDPKALLVTSVETTVPVLTICIGIESLLFYAILHNWLGHSLAIRTNTPFLRIFTDLVYANSPVVLINTILVVLDAAVATGFLTGFLVAALTLLPNDLPDWLGVVLGILMSVVYMLLLLGPLVAVELYYYTILLTSLFHVSRRRAIILTVVVTIFADVPSVLFTFWRGDIVTPLNLSSTELVAAQTVEVDGSLISDYTISFGRQPSMREMRAFVDSQPKNSLYRLMHAQEIATLEKLDTNDSADGYRYSVRPGRHWAYVEATPTKCGNETIRSFIGDAPGGRLYSSDRCSSATFTDSPVVLVGH
jgi:hypothetical protein